MAAKKKARKKPLHEHVETGVLDLSKMELRLNIEVVRKDGYYRITSPNVPGMYLGATDWEKAAADIGPVIKMLLKGNCGILW